LNNKGFKSEFYDFLLNFSIYFMFGGLWTEFFFLTEPTFI